MGIFQVQGGILQGKRGLVCGVSSERSIGRAIARAAYREGALLALTYRNGRWKENVERFAQELGAAIVFQCDLSNDAEVSSAINILTERWEQIDFLVHSIAYAPLTALREPIRTLSQADFDSAFASSTFSLLPVTNRVVPLMKQGGSILTISSLGSERVLAGYGVMGPCKAALESMVRYLAFELGPLNIRVNGLSAGPVRTLSARAIPTFTDMLHAVEERAPLKRNITQEEIGNAALFFLSDLSSGVTGDILHVDAGIHSMSV